MRRLLALVIAMLPACKERGTISIPLVEPCAGRTASAAAIYLKPATTCAAVITDDQTCGLGSFECAGDCIAACGDGYCDMSTVSAGISVDPPRAGDYALVMLFRYGPGSLTDEGIACFDVTVDADGTESTDVADDQGVSCCVP